MRRSKAVPVVPAIPATETESLWTKEDAAAYLKVQPATIYQLTRPSQSSSPAIFARGKFMRFRRSETDKWLEDSRAGAA
jgi:excisionase family DNA binding protein